MGRSPRAWPSATTGSSCASRLAYTTRPMAQIREIKKRIGGVKTVERITKTMQMIATAKFTSAMQHVSAARPYSERIDRLMAEALTAAGGDFEHPLIAGPSETPSRQRVLVITSNRGMCGAYNAHALRTATTHIRELRDLGRELELETAGKKAVGYFKFQKIPVATSHSIGDQPGYDEIERLAVAYIEDFVAGRHDAVHVVSVQFVSVSRQVPRVIQLLPLKPAAAPETPPDESAGGGALYDFSPSVQAILDQLMPLAVKTILFQAFLEARVSEQVMRMVAMKAATENAGELGRTLTRSFNRARQAQITTELMEIIGGASALE